MVYSTVQKTEKRFRKLDIALTLLFLLSIVLVVIGIEIYRLTVIETKYLFVTVSIGTLLLAIPFILIPKAFLNTFWTLFVAAAIGGGTSYFLLLYVNRKLADEQELSESFVIRKTGNLGKGRRSSCGQPYAVIDFYGVEKQLVFSCEYQHFIWECDTVRVRYREGFFGFPVITEKVLIPRTYTTPPPPMMAP